MQLFFLDSNKNKISLSQEESKHISKVLRKKEGDIINFTNGKGYLFIGKIISSNPRKTEIEIIDQIEKIKGHNYYLHIAISPTKNLDRFEWFLEKATEIGIDEITPIICKNTYRKQIKTDRCIKILQSAIKQSIKYYLPKLNQATEVMDFINKDFKEDKYIAHCNNIKKINLIDEKKVKKSIIMIGPEGDFSNEEIKESCKMNYKSINLGNSRLRTETAGIVAVNTINNLN